jgi:hypothetical protein
MVEYRSGHAYLSALDWRTELPAPAISRGTVCRVLPAGVFPGLYCAEMPEKSYPHLLRLDKTQQLTHCPWFPGLLQDKGTKRFAPANTNVRCCRSLCVRVCHIITHTGLSVQCRQRTRALILHIWRTPPSRRRMAFDCLPSRAPMQASQL